MTRRPRRKPVVPWIEALEERQLLRHGVGPTVSLEEQIRNLVHQARVERAHARTDRLSIAPHARSGDSLAAPREFPAGTVTIENPSASTLDASPNAAPTAVFIVYLSTAGDSPATVDFHTNAAPAGDYALSLPASERASGYSLNLGGGAAGSSGVLTIPAHQRQAVIDVTPTVPGTGGQGGTVDLALELDGAYRTWRPRLAYRPGAPAIASTTIVEPSAAPPVTPTPPVVPSTPPDTVTIGADGSLTASASATPQPAFTITRAGPTGAALTVSFRVAGSPNGTVSVANPSDYVISGSGVTFQGGSGTVTIPAGQKNATIDVTPTAGANAIGPNGAKLALSFADGPGYTVSGSRTPSIVIESGTTTPTTPTGPAQPAYTDTLYPFQNPSIVAAEGASFSSTQIAIFSDSNTSAPASSFNATITWGDGGNSTGTVVPWGSAGSGEFAIEGSYTYNEEGSYPLSVTVSGSNTNTLTMSTPGGAMIDDAPISLTPNGPFRPQAVDAQFTLPLARLIDANPSATSADYTSVTINWGDGSTSQGYVSGNAVNGTHQYTAASDYTVSVTVNDDGGSFATANVPITVTNLTPQQSPTTCPPPVAQTQPPQAGGDSGASSNTQGGASAGNGGVTKADPNDLQSNGFGTTWGQDLGWTNLGVTGAGSNNGNGMVNAFLPSLQQTGTGGVVAVNTAYNDTWFAPNGNGGYTAQFFAQATLEANPANANQLIMIDSAGDTFTFQGFGAGVSAAQQGQFVSFTDPYGNSIAVSAYTSSGQIAQVQRTGPVAGGNVTESYNYTYIPSGVNAGLIQQVQLYRGYSPSTAGTSGVVRAVVYTYYDGTDPLNGNAGDLELAQVEDGSGNILDTTYYRYYTPADVAAGQNGYVGGLKFMLLPDSYARANAALASDGGVAAATDAELAPYADSYYEYDSTGRVTKSVVQGTSCSCSNGQGTFTYQYITNTNPNFNPTDLNQWQTETIETLPDNNQQLIFTNSAGEVILSALNDITDAGNSNLSGKVIATYYRYDTAGRLIMTAQPSAVTIQDPTTLNTAAANNNDIVGYDSANGTYQYLAPNNGVINITDYGATTTAGASSPGDVLGYVKDDKVQQGYAGTPILLDTTQYISHTLDGIHFVYEVATSTVYRNTDGSGAETTTTSYTWYANTNGIASTTVSLPVISSTQNGPGTAGPARTLDNPGKIFLPFRWTLVQLSGN